MRRAFAAMAFIVATIASAQTFEPADPSQVNGRTLTVPEENFAIDVPLDGCVWKHQRNERGETWSAVQPETGSVFTVTFPTEQMPVDVRRGRNFAVGLCRSVERHGGRCGAAVVEPSTKPLEGSVRIEVPVTLSNGTSQVWRHVLISGTKVIVLQNVTDASPENFDAFVSTFRFLKPPAPPPALPKGLDFTSPVTLLSVLALLVIPAAAGLNRFVFRDPLQLSGGVAASVIIFVIVAIAHGALALLMRVAADPVDQGERFGEIVGSAAIPLGVALFFAVRIARRREGRRRRQGMRPIVDSPGAKRRLFGGLALMLFSYVVTEQVIGESKGAVSVAVVVEIAIMLLGLWLVIGYARRRPIAPEVPIKKPASMAGGSGTTRTSAAAGSLETSDQRRSPT